ncbi:hypothetical protein TVAG_375900 [Trichomonas vaginalis G3]|uniref:Uncharacterized protein n=1 Tax=Trichomonas vaginalis (strain ATCC PRA-98 / G3) TaxID=412133 RepID=A2G1M2_TRIV3|nr:protein CBG06246 family [Trichomonas vaginalis G3]EAX88942.1 hypothetical protein TVAG_375900 [Trichomonas vaginalis G3]KAI5535801.1 protein CBG06246 family [Trichomonas vaginalis G3]|eukprot:XP_001301872.1 hypothetical protein [Trichomonas vaginalis G3]
MNKSCTNYSRHTDNEKSENESFNEEQINSDLQSQEPIGCMTDNPACSAIFSLRETKGPLDPPEVYLEKFKNRKDHKLYKYFLWMTQSIYADSIEYEFLDLCEYLILPIISNIFEFDKKYDALEFIRSLSDVERDDTALYCLPRGKISEVNRVFLGSRRIFFNVFVEQYLKRSQIFPYLIETDDFGMELSGAKFEIKTSGAQFGGKITDTINNKVYYVKVHQNYPLKNMKDGLFVTEYQQELDEGNQSNFLNHMYDRTQARTVDLKEPFMYKVLESLKLGAKVDFIINPFINFGFYIVSESLSNDKQTFIDIKSFRESEKTFCIQYYINDFRIDIVNSRTSFGELKQHFKRKTIVDLTVIDIIFKIFSLRDAHCCNLGFIDKHDSPTVGNEYYQAKKWLERGQDFRIIDFLPSKKRKCGYIIPQIVDNYLIGDSEIYDKDLPLMRNIVSRLSAEEKELMQFSNRSLVIKPRNDNIKREKFFMGFSALNQIQKLVDESLSSEEITKHDSNKNTEDIERFRLFLEKKARDIKSLMMQKRNDFQFLRNRTNASLLGFKSRCGIKREHDEKPDFNYIEDAFEDLDYYVNGVYQNYKNLKKFITDGYFEFFDEDGNFKPY